MTFNPSGGALLCPRAPAFHWGTILNILGLPDGYIYIRGDECIGQIASQRAKDALAYLTLDGWLIVMPTPELDSMFELWEDHGLRVWSRLTE